MPNYRRDRQAGATWFFTVVTYQRQKFLCDERVRDSLRSVIQRVRSARPFNILGWVLLPDHFHCIWSLPEGDADYSTRIALIKRAITIEHKHWLTKRAVGYESRKRHRESTVWQRRFWEHRIRDDRDLRAHLDYIHYNPVKHGLCLIPQAWPYSTLHRYQSLGMYTANWAVNPENLDTQKQNVGQWAVE
jgi:putative transposase